MQWLAPIDVNVFFGAVGEQAENDIFVLGVRKCLLMDLHDEGDVSTVWGVLIEGFQGIDDSY